MSTIKTNTLTGTTTAGSSVTDASTVFVTTHGDLA